MELCIEYSDIFHEKHMNMPKPPLQLEMQEIKIVEKERLPIAKYKLYIQRLRRPNLNITVTPNNTTSDIYMKIKAEIYREMYTNKNTDVIDVIPQIIYDVFIANQFGEIISMPYSTTLSIEEFIQNNMDILQKEYDIYVVDEFTFQTLMREKTKTTLLSYLQTKIKQYTTCITNKPH